VCHHLWCVRVALSIKNPTKQILCNSPGLANSVRRCRCAGGKFVTHELYICRRRFGCSSVAQPLLDNLWSYARVGVLTWLLIKPTIFASAKYCYVS
jgi:hypothetical protein